MDSVDSFSRPFVAAGALFFDEHARLLLVRPTYKETWDIPGGYVETGETPRQACAREIGEELGLDLPPGRLLLVDWAPNADEGDKVLFVFDGGTLSREQRAAIRLPPKELTSWELTSCEFVAADAIGHRLSPRLTRRVTAALAARVADRMSYVENSL